MSKMTGAEAIIKSIRRYGVDTVFGLPGGQTYHLFDAIHNEGDSLRVINSRHEQGVAYMAYGYARSTGRMGVYSVVPGPGILNTTSALCTAYAGKRTGTVPGWANPVAMDRQGSRFPARNTRSAGHPAAPDKMGGTYRNTCRRAAPRQPGLPGTELRAYSPGRPGNVARHHGSAGRRGIAPCFPCPGTCTGRPRPGRSGSPPARQGKEPVNRNRPRLRGCRTGTVTGGASPAGALHDACGAARALSTTAII